MFGFWGAFDFFDEYDPWSGRAEKSQSAIRREERAKQKFDTVKLQLEHTALQNKLHMINLGCKAPQAAKIATHTRTKANNKKAGGGSGTNVDDDDDFEKNPSLFRMLPPENLQLILQYVKPSNFDDYVAPEPSRRRNNNKKKKKRTTIEGGGDDVDYDDSDDDEEEETSPVLVDVFEILDSLCDPGSQHTFDLLTPDVHLTGPCFRDFGRYVRSNPGWTCKRIEANKSEHNKQVQNRKGKAYYVKVIYIVPGVPTKTSKERNKKKKKKKKASSSKKKKAPPVAAPAAAAAVTNNKKKKKKHTIGSDDSDDDSDYEPSGFATVSSKNKNNNKKKKASKMMLKSPPPAAAAVASVIDASAAAAAANASAVSFTADDNLDDTKPPAKKKAKTTTNTTSSSSSA